MSDPLNPPKNRIAEVMESKGVGVRELARRSGLSLSCVRKLKRGGNDGQIHTWVLIADSLEVTVDELIGR